MVSWDELVCFCCGTHIGWLIYAGARGYAFCDDCKEKDDKEKELIRAAANGEEGR